MFFKFHAFKIPLIGLMLWSSITVPSIAQNQTALSITESTQLNSWLKFFRPPKRGTPTDTGNGSSRDGLRCPDDTAVMHPLLPEERYGLTLSERPAIFVNIPETSATQALLVFRNEAGTTYHRAILPIDTTNTVVGFRLPDDSPALAPDETYRWSLSFICGSHFSLNDPTVIGWVNRQVKTPTIEQTLLAHQSAEETAQWLGNHGYWYDMAQQLVSHPELLQ